jgi:hypothetical protein
VKTHIPITKALSRERVTTKSNESGIYPLLNGYQENYNFKNICESLDKWYLYSNNNQKNLNQMLKLYTHVNENGTLREIEIAADIVTRNIISIPGYTAAVPQLKSMDNTENILEAIEEAAICDKVVKNYADLSKRFNVNHYIQKNCKDLECCIHGLCSFVDTYNIGINTKYRIALEETLYGFNRNGVHCSQKDIVEHVTDYFLMTNMDAKDNSGVLLNIMEDVLNSNPFITETSYIDFIREASKNHTAKDEFESLDEAVFVESYEDIAEKAIAAFKGGADKGVKAFTALINKLLTVKEEKDIIDGTVNVLSISFYFFIVIGITSISAWGGILALITSAVLSKMKDWEVSKRVLKTWYKHRKKVKDKLNKERDPQKKKRLEEYLEKMNKSIEKIENHYDRLAPEGDSAASHSDSDDLDMKLDFKFENATEISSYINTVIDTMKDIKWNNDIANNRVFCDKDIYLTSTLETVDYLTEFACKFPYMIDYKSMRMSISEAIDELRKTPTSENYVRIAALIDCREAVSEISDDLVTEDNIEKVLQNMNEIRYMGDVIGNSIQSYNELSIGSSLTLAIDKMIDTAKDLDVKAQVAARTIDAASRYISHSIEKSLTAENREAVIRGEILPSMSKCVKLAILTGGAFLISPAIAIVALVVRFVISKRIQAKERQLVLNELDVELNMVDRYIRQAEEKNDLKRVKELLLTKKKLQSQYARLRYNLKIEWNDKDVQELRGKENED